MSWGFQPDAARATALSAEVNLRLLASLRYVFGEVGAELGADLAVVETWLSNLERGARPDPLVHALFHAIVADVQAGEYDLAKASISRLLGLGAAEPGLCVHPLAADPAARRPVALFSRFADIEEDNRLDFVASAAERTPDFVAMIQAGLELISRNDPALDGELRALLAEILVVEQGPDHRFRTAAISCFQNWGGLLINPSSLRDDLDVVETLAHEATHLTLFALALDEPLLTNASEERYYSPIRQTLRSMDGVYHATIVSARVTRAMTRQAEACTTGSDFGRLALDRASKAAQAFDGGVEIVESGARLSGLGRDILEDSKRFISQARKEQLVSA